MAVEQLSLKRRLIAVLLADVVGYSRLMSLDENDTHSRLSRLMNDLIEPTIVKYAGRIVRSMGDGLLVEFGSASDAVRCAIEIQQGLAKQTIDPDRQEPIRLRIGVNTGDVIVDHRDLYGHSVNIAARLEGIAEPGSVYVSQGIYDQMRGLPGLRFTDKGLHRVKNIDYPIRVFQVDNDSPARDSGARRRPRVFSFARFRPRLSRKSGFRIVLAGLITALIGVEALYLRYRAEDIAPPPNSIIVLPFRNLSADWQDDYFADAVTEDLTTDLARISKAFVIASATALTYKGKAVDAREIGRECGVRYLLEGSLGRTGDIVEINAQLIDTKTGAHIWADRFSYQSKTLTDLQETVTGRVAASLDVQLVKAESRAQTVDTSFSNNALRHRLMAMALLMGPMTPIKSLAARRDAEEAIRLDPGSAESWALLANVLVSDYLNRWNGAGKREVERAKEALQQALSLDSSVPLAHYAAGFIRRVDGDHEGALYELDEAIRLNPNFARAYAQKANELMFLGRPVEAVPVAEKAVRLSPRDPSIGVFYWVIGRAYFAQANYQEAARWLEKSVVERPNLWFNRAWLIGAYSLSGHDKEARHVLDQFRKAFPDYTLAHIAEIYGKEARHDNPSIQAAAQKLYTGLRQAGLSER